MDASIGGAVIACQQLFESISRTWRCDWEKEVEQYPSFKKICSSFDQATRQEGIFEHNSGRPLLHAFFDEGF
jgi:hypothetical protein